MENSRLKFTYIILSVIAVALIIFYFAKSPMNNEEKDLTNTEVTPISENVSSAVFKTNYGEFTVEFYGDDAPNTVGNFIKLAGSGFYDGTRFHRVIEGFMIQGGDPLSKDVANKSYWGTGGPGYKFDDEIGNFSHNSVGTIAMANSGPDTNGSQFFVNVNENNSLDGGYAVFGKVVDGMDIVMKISQVETTMDPAGREKSSPVSDVILEKVTLK